MLIVGLFSTGCASGRGGTAAEKESSSCPPPQWADKRVAEELERVPFRGYPELADLGMDLADACKSTASPLVCQFSDRVQEELKWIRPEEGFEHTWAWIARVEKLNEALEACRK
jgi:hypothetical protein